MSSKIAYTQGDFVEYVGFRTEEIFKLKGVVSSAILDTDGLNRGLVYVAWFATKFSDNPYVYGVYEENLKHYSPPDEERVYWRLMGWV
jgi:hypothetical protein